MYEIDKTLPLFLRNSIKTFLSGKSEYENSGYNHFEQDYRDLQKNINACENDHLITSEQAQLLREQFLNAI